MMEDSVVSESPETQECDRRSPLSEQPEDRSSATEGPDSPDLSPSSSPVPMMLPSDSPDSDFPAPRYSVKFTDNVSKDGDSIRYTLNVRKLYESGEIVTLSREWEDLQYLDHQLTTKALLTSPGLIMPPLPAKPATDSAGAESRSRKQLGSSNRSVIGDSSQWNRDCKMLEKFLEMIVNHPVLGKDPQLKAFLETAEAPVRPAKLKKGWLSGVKDKWDARNIAAKDSDEWFGKEREWATAYSAHIKDASDKMNNVINARLRLVQQLGHLSGALSITVAGNEGANGLYNKLNAGFSGCVDTIKIGVENEAAEAEGSLANCLDIWSRCLDQENAMLLRRTCLMLDWEAGVRAVDKARPNREEAAKAVRDEAEKEFITCSEAARAEIKAFHNKRLADFKQALLYYVEGQVKCYRENQSALSSCLSKMKDFPLPQVKDSMFDPNDNDKK